MREPNKYTQVLASLPYAEPFLFVDELTQLSDDGARGSYTYAPDLEFYKGHFVGQPVTPGVILTETMAQIGVVSLGIYLLRDQQLADLQIAMTSTEVEYLLPVFPSERMTVISEKVYFRFGKLKCRVSMHNEANQVVCKGVIAGIVRAGKQSLAR